MPVLVAAAAGEAVAKAQLKNARRGKAVAAAEALASVYSLRRRRLAFTCATAAPASTGEGAWNEPFKLICLRRPRCGCHYGSGFSRSLELLFTHSSQPRTPELKGRGSAATGVVRGCLGADARRARGALLGAQIASAARQLDRHRKAIFSPPVAHRRATPPVYVLSTLVALVVGVGEYLNTLWCGAWTFVAVATWWYLRAAHGRAHSRADSIIDRWVPALRVAHGISALTLLLALLATHLANLSTKARSDAVASGSFLHRPIPLGSRIATAIPVRTFLPRARSPGSPGSMPPM